MKKATRLLALLAGASLLVFCTGTRADAQDPVNVQPYNFRVIAENEHVRLLEIHLQPGELTAMIAQPANVTYALTASRLQFTYPDQEPRVVDLHPGDLDCSSPVMYSVENIGDTDALLLSLELKPATMQIADTSSDATQLLQAIQHNRVSVDRPKERAHAKTLTPADMLWVDGPAGLPPGCKMAVLEGDLKKAGPFTIRFRAPAGFTVPPHTHPGIEHVTVLSGSMYLGMGETFDKTKAKKYPAGSFLVMPPEMRHFVWVDEETVIQVHGMGPWGITYVNPADDPAKKK